MFNSPMKAAAPGALGLVINDGYSELAYVKPEPRLYPAVRFEFRPMLVTERASYHRANESLRTVEEVRKYMAAEMRSHLVKWDLRNEKDELVPITVENIMRLKPKLFDRIFIILIGEMAGDDDPLSAKIAEESDQDAIDILQATKEGKTVREIREERDLKNSSPPSS